MIANQRQTKSPQSSLSLKGYVTQRATKKIGVLFYIRKWRRTGRGRGLKAIRRFGMFLQLMLQTRLLIFWFSLSRRPYLFLLNTLIRYLTEARELLALKLCKGKFHEPAQACKNARRTP